MLPLLLSSHTHSFHIKDLRVSNSISKLQTHSFSIKDIFQLSRAHTGTTSQRAMNDIKSLPFLYCDDAVFGSTRLKVTNERPRQCRLYPPPQMVTDNIQLYPLPINHQEALFGTTRLSISNERPVPCQLYSPPSAWSTSSLSLCLERSWTLRTPSEITAKVFRPWYRKTADSITRLRRWSAGKRAR